MAFWGLLTPGLNPLLSLFLFQSIVAMPRPAGWVTGGAGPCPEMALVGWQLCLGRGTQGLGDACWEGEPTLGGLGAARPRLGQSGIRCAGGAQTSLRGLGRRLSRWGEGRSGETGRSPSASTILVAFNPHGFVCLPISACLSLSLLSFSRCLSLSLLSLPRTLFLYFRPSLCISFSLSFCLCFSLSSSLHALILMNFSLCPWL